MEYHDFLRTKAIIHEPHGFEVDRNQLCHSLFEWQKDVVVWALKKGRCALLQDCGMGKTLEQLSWAEQVHEHTGKPVLILAPLSVADQTVKEAKKFGLFCKRVRHMEELSNICVTNYEMVEHFNLDVLGGIVLDESSILKNFSGKTKQLLVERCAHIPYRLCCTATPSPNDYTELGNHAEFLGVMSRSEMLSTFFVHDGGNTSKWRLKGHAKQAFFGWVASWACSMTSPADLGYSSVGYTLPPLRIHECVVRADELEDESGQTLLFAQNRQTLSQRRSSRRNSLKTRCEKAAQIANADSSQCVLWCDLNDESAELSRLVADAVEVKGSNTNEEKSQRIVSFSEGYRKCLISKPSIAGWGMNWQQCHRMIFVGLSDSFEAYYQAVRRCWRFGQKNPVDVYIVISDAEDAVKENLERKQQEAQEMTYELVKHTKEILKVEIKSTCRMIEQYIAPEKMELPNWLKGEVA